MHKGSMQTQEVIITHSVWTSCVMLQGDNMSWVKRWVRVSHMLKEKSSKAKIRRLKSRKHSKDKEVEYG